MPLIARNELPTYQRLKQEGQEVLTPHRAEQQDIRPLHIGLLNMMPDAALAATERQFFRLVSSSNQISQFYIHPFTLDELPRGDKARQHIQQYYESFDDIKANGLDALIISGANVTAPNLSEEVFWQPLIEVIEWASNNVTSTLCSCLASHAVMDFRYNQPRRRLLAKQWGLFNHHVVDVSHPLVSDINSRMDVPHSRFNAVDPEQFKAAGLHILVESSEAGVQLAVSPDGFKMVFFQGHPEYDKVSLLKEYKREIGLFIDGKTSIYPPFPSHYFDLHTQSLLNEFEQKVRLAKDASAKMPDFPENYMLQRIHNTWHDTGVAMVANWIGKIYQLTHSDRHKPYMDHVDPDDPLDWLKQ